MEKSKITEEELENTFKTCMRETLKEQYDEFSVDKLKRN